MVWILCVAVLVCSNTRFFGRRSRFQSICATVKRGFSYNFEWDGSAVSEVNPYFMSFHNTLAHCFYGRGLPAEK